MNKIKKALEERKYKIVVTNQGKKVLTKAERLNVDLIILDLNLLGIDGLNICRILKNDIHTASTPVIIIGKDNEESVVKGLESGADDYIIRPFNMAELAARVSAVLRTTRR